YVMFFGPVLFFFLLFSLPFLSNKGERSPIKRPWAVVGSAAVVVIISALLVAGTKAHFAPAFHTKSLPASIFNSDDTLALLGGVLFEQKACLYCHKMADRGGRVGPDLTHVANRMNEQEMMIRIVNGARNMPAYGSSLSKDELTRLIAFLKSRK
ncbi:MAG TPA: cytochrome c, partial [Flavisolibacter sp.]|nr:cytochrome c [Flavisolibacter sp.]